MPERHINHVSSSSTIYENGQFFFAKIYYLIPVDYDKAKAHEITCKRRCRQHPNYLVSMDFVVSSSHARHQSQLALDNANPQSKQGASESVHFYHLPDTLHRKQRTRITFVFCKYSILLWLKCTIVCASQCKQFKIQCAALGSRLSANTDVDKFKSNGFFTWLNKIDMHFRVFFLLESNRFSSATQTHAPILTRYGIRCHNKSIFGRTKFIRRKNKIHMSYSACLLVQRLMK